jgi:hypothetical protein
MTIVHVVHTSEEAHSGKITGRSVKYTLGNINNHFPKHGVELQTSQGRLEILENQRTLRLINAE